MARITGVNLSVALGKLTPKARAKLAKLSAAVEDNRALAATLQARHAAVEHMAVIARNNLGATDGATRVMDKRHRDRLAAEVEALEQQLANVDRERAARAASLARAERVLMPLMQVWLPTLAEGGSGWTDGPVFADVEASANGRPRQGETIAQAIARVRSIIFKLQGEIGHLKTAPPPVAHIKAAITSQIDAMAREGAPHVDISGGQVRIVWPDMASFNNAAAPLSASKMVCWLARDTVLGALLKSVDGIEGGPPLADRPKLEAELRKQLLSAERDEEALIELAESQGDAGIERRSDANPHAVLGIGWAAEVAAIQVAAE
jgi:hypothetical protein